MNKETLALIDGDHILYVVCPNKVVRDESGFVIKDAEGNRIYEEKTLEDVERLCDLYIQNMLDAVGASKYIGTLSTKCFRYTINPLYKANRKDKELPQYFDTIRKRLVDKWGFFEIKGFEADDLVVSFREYFKEEYETIILSTDKDILMLPGRHYNPKKVEFINTSVEDAHYYFWSSMLVGDTADNIKGIPKIGPVKAKQLLSTFSKRDYCKEVFNAYVSHFGELEGIKQYSMNYQCLKICDNIKDLGLDETSVPLILEYGKRMEVG